MSERFGKIGLTIALSSLCLGQPVTATTVIATPGTFDSVFARIQAGDTITMVGTFGEVRMANRSFSSRVTLDASRAIFTKQLVLDHISYLLVSGGVFNVGDNGLYAKGAAVWGGANIYFKFSTFNGSADQFGITFGGTSNAQVSNSRFTGFSSSVNYSSVTAGYAGANTFLRSFSDGIDIADSHGVVASGNTCSGGNPAPGAHPDCIQMWSVAGRALQSDNIVMNNRAFGPTQGFTSFAGGGGGLRLTISNNFVQTSYPQGVACYDCIDSTISNNQISTLPGSNYQTGLRVIGGTGNTVSNNLVAAYTELRPHGAQFDDDPTLNTSQAELIDGSFFNHGDAVAETLVDVDVSPFNSIPNGMADPVPEPSSWVLMILGLGAVGIAGRRRTPTATPILSDALG